MDMSTKEKESMESKTFEQAAQLNEEAEQLYAESNNVAENERVPILNKARELSLAAHKLDPTNLEYLRHLCSVTGRLAEESGLSDKIRIGFEFKGLLDKAIEMDTGADPDTTFELCHMRGRFTYSVANLSLIERTVARAFGSLPTVDINQGIEDLLKANSIFDGLAENELFIGKCYLSNGDVGNAKNWLTKAAENGDVTNLVDAEYIEEAKNILNSL